MEGARGVKIEAPEVKVDRISKASTVAVAIRSLLERLNAAVDAL